MNIRLKKITYFAPLGLSCSMWDCQSSQWYVGSFYFYVDLFTNLYWVCYNIVFMFLILFGYKACGTLAPLPRTKLGREVINFVSILLCLRHLWQWDEATKKKAGRTLGTWALVSWEEEEDPTKESRKPGNGEKAQETAVSWLTGYFWNKVMYSTEVQQKRGWQTSKLTWGSFSTMVGWEPGWSITSIQLNVWWLPFSTKHWKHTQTPALT